MMVIHVYILFQPPFLIIFREKTRITTQNRHFRPGSYGEITRRLYAVSP